MQEGHPNYYLKTTNWGVKGCCLVCEEGYEDCLCYQCKCKKCYFYTPEDGENLGECDLAKSNIEEGVTNVPI